jgi:hypothetical protein
VTVTCQTCTAPVGDAYLCGGCTNQLRATLDSVADLAAELDTTITRQAVLGVRGGPRAAEKPLPFHVQASEAAWVLRNTLGGWARVIIEEHGPAASAHRPTSLENGEQVPQDHRDQEGPQWRTSGPTAVDASSPASAPNTAPNATKTSAALQQATTTALGHTEKAAAAAQLTRSGHAAGSKTSSADGTSPSPTNAATNSQPYAPPADTPAALARFLLARLEHLRHHPAAGEAMDEIRGAAQAAQRAIDHPRTRHTFPVGPCPDCGAHLTAYIRRDEPPVITCDGETRHTYAAHQWARVGQRIMSV